MITCTNQGPNGPNFSSLVVNLFTGDKVAFQVESKGLLSDSVILDKKNVAILARKLLAYCGETFDAPLVVTGTL